MWLNCVYKFDCVSLLLGKLQKGIILYLKNPVKKLVYGVSQLALSEHHLLCSLWRLGLLTFLCLDFSSFFFLFNFVTFLCLTFLFVKFCLVTPTSWKWHQISLHDNFIRTETQTNKERKKPGLTEIQGNKYRLWYTEIQIEREREREREIWFKNTNNKILFKSFA